MNMGNEGGWERTWCEKRPAAAQGGRSKLGLHPGCAPVIGPHGHPFGIMPPLRQDGSAQRLLDSPLKQIQEKFILYKRARGNNALAEMVTSKALPPLWAARGFNPQGQRSGCLLGTCPPDPNISASDLPGRFRTEFAKTSLSVATFCYFLPMCKFSNVPGPSLLLSCPQGGDAAGIFSEASSHQT